MKKYLVLILSAFIGLASYAQTSNDADAEAFILACDADPAGKLTVEQKNYITQMVEGLKSIGVWNSMVAVYPFVGGTAFKHKFNLKDPRDLNAAYRLAQGQFSTITTVDNNLGVSFAGSYNYLQTFISPVTAGLTKANFHLSVYNRTGSDFAYEIGNQVTSQGSLALGVNRAGATVGLAAGSGNLFTSTISPNSLIILNSTSSTNANIYGKGVLKSTYTVSRTGNLDNNQITLGTLGNLSSPSFESAKQLQFATVGFSLTNTQAIQLSHLIYYLQGILQRQ
jgi:hypothetical protein